MKKEDVQKLDHGVYRLYWKDETSSVGVVGSAYNGSRFLICSNWTEKTPEALASYMQERQSAWDNVERVELISNQKGDKGTLPESLRIIEEMSRQAERVNKVNEGIVEWTPFRLASSSTQSLEQPPGKTLMELAYGEEAELIRAAATILINGTSTSGVSTAAGQYLINKFKEATNVESD